jgi:hypothetical protein
VVYHKKYLVADLRAPVAAEPAIAFLVEGDRVRMKKCSICRETARRLKNSLHLRSQM